MNLFECLRILPTDYSEYGGEVRRWERNDTDYPDCSTCNSFTKLKEPNDNDWGVCANKNSPRAGMLTWEHQAGFHCHQKQQPQTDLIT
jgi:hypothetical protein